MNNIVIRTPGNKLFSNCIISKVSHALGIRKVKPRNIKYCSQKYWESACEIVGEHYKVPEQKITKARMKRKSYMLR